MFRRRHGVEGAAVLLTTHVLVDARAFGPVQWNPAHPAHHLPLPLHQVRIFCSKHHICKVTVENILWPTECKSFEQNLLVDLLNLICHTKTITYTQWWAKLQL